MLKPYQIAYKNLLRKKTRTVLTVFGIALSTWVLVSLFGFNRGYEKALNKDIDNMGFQMLVAAKGCPYEAATLMLKGGTSLRYMNESIISEITRNKEVEQTTPMLMHVYFDPNKGENGGLTSYLGVDPKTFPQMKAYLAFVKGGWFAGENAKEVVMGYEAAELEQREVGDKILVPEKNIELTVIGVLKRSGTQDDGTIFIPIKTLQSIFKMQNKLTGVGVKVRKDADMAKLEDKMYNLPDVQVVSLAQVKQTIINLIGTAKMMVFSIAVIAVLIAVIGVVNTVLMSVFERFHEIGILKSMGALPKDIFKLILYETAMLCALGGAAGNLLAIGLERLTDYLVRIILPYAPTGMLIQIDAKLALSGMAIVILVGVVSGMYPAWQASKVRPMDSIKSAGAN
jgi:putative ABC transport system permease protein